MNLIYEYSFYTLIILNLILGIWIFFADGLFQKTGRWISFLSIFFILLCSALILSEFYRGGVNYEERTLLWVSPPLETVSLLLGVLLNPFCLLVVSVFSVGMLLLIFLFDYQSKIYGVIQTSLSGVILSFISNTFLGNLVGITICVVSGFFLLTLKKDREPEEEKFLFRYLVEHFFGLVLLVLGCTLIRYYIEADLSENIWVSLSLLFCGFFLHSRCFPLPTSVRFSSQCPTPLLVSIVFLPPVLGVVSIFYRLFPEIPLLHGNLMMVYIFIAVAGAVSLISLVQRDAKKRILASLPSLFCFVMIALFVNGTEKSLPFFMTTLMGVFFISILSPFLDTKTHEIPKNGKNYLTLPFLFLATGGVGAMSGSAWFYSLSELSFSPPVMGLYLFGLALNLIVLWRVFFFDQGVFVTVGWKQIVSIFILFLLSLDFFWTGNVMGGFWFGGVGENLNVPFVPLMTQLFGTEFLHQGALSFDLHFGGLWLFSILVPFWFYKKEIFVAEKGNQVVMVLRDFLNFDGFIIFCRRKIMALASFVEWWLDDQFWLGPIFSRIYRLLKRCAIVVDETSDLILNKMSTAFSGMMNFSGRSLQLVQNGNLQWYLFFSLAIGISLLMIFLGQ